MGPGGVGTSHPGEPVSLASITTALEAEKASLDRELTEIELLLQQVKSESERYEQRRTQLAERLSTLEATRTTAPPELEAAREHLYDQTRRAALMSSQLQVLEGKQRTLQRYKERLSQTLAHLAQIGGDGGTHAPAAFSARAVMAVMEELRREIARQMHDGPAQSIANIALQTHIVQRLFKDDPAQAAIELGALAGMVQSTLEATKRFIFEVRPMVLDDLGIVATLRRSAHDRSQQSGTPIHFESVGADSRLDREVESNLFRLVDEALTAYLEGRPSELTVHMDWAVDVLETTVRSQLADSRSDHGETATDDEPPASRAGEEVPPALAAMINDQRERRLAGIAAKRQARGLSAAAWAAIRERAEALGISATLEDDGELLRIRVSIPRL
ncbi:hypothetical protein BH24CHL7_BH24CHL7_02950 [soil metagenome]